MKRLFVLLSLAILGGMVLIQPAAPFPPIFGAY